MKGKLNTDISTSYGNTFLVGTEVEIVNGWCGCDGNFYQCEFLNGIQITINANNIDITDYSPCINWEQRHYELTKAAMQGFCSNPNEQIINADSNVVAKWSINFADAMIKKLKELK